MGSGFETSDCRLCERTGHAATAARRRLPTRSAADGPIGNATESRRWMIRAEPRPTWAVELLAQRARDVIQCVTPDRGCKAAPFKEPPLTAESGGATRAALLAMREHRGTGSSNSLPSRGESCKLSVRRCRPGLNRTQGATTRQAMNAAQTPSLISPRRISLPRKGHRVGLHIDLFEACSAFTRVAACTLARSPIRDPLIEGFSHFVTSMTAPIASGWSESPGGPCTHRKAPPCHGAHP